MFNLVLTEKGQSIRLDHEADLNQFSISLKWKGDIDLDLLAFYQMKNQQVGSLFSSNYKNGDHGQLHAFPFMQLSQDAIGNVQNHQDHEETITALKLSDEIESLYLFCLNHTALSKNQEISLHAYDVKIELKLSSRMIEIPLTASQIGSIAQISKITNFDQNPVLYQQSQIMSLQKFYQEIPGAEKLQIASKIVLQHQGESAFLIRPKQSLQKIKAKLTWQSDVDLDLYCFYLKKNHETYEEHPGFIAKLFGKAPKISAEVFKIYFRNKGSLSTSPYIKLDQDAGIGDKGGDNEENIEIAKTSDVDALIFATNIYNKPDAIFSSYDGKVIVECMGQIIEVPLVAKAKGNWAYIAMIDCSQDQIKVINLNQIKAQEPTYDDFMLHLHSSV
jgi:tellurite resistance protein TerA